MTSILFVCLGNICRSPMAEFVFKDMARRAGREFEIASAAVSDEEAGNPVYPPARRELAKHGISCAGKTARQITSADCAHFDRIVYMDAQNGRALRRRFPQYAEKFEPLLPRDVADPWYTGDFQAAWDDIVRGCEALWRETA